MNKEKRKKVIIAMLLVLAILLALIIVLLPLSVRHETVKEMMRDAVLHNRNKVRIPGGIEVDPSLISGFIVTGGLLIFALLIRLILLPRFKRVPGRVQIVIETWVGFFENLAESNSPHRNEALGAYIFAVGSYIFTGTMLSCSDFRS